MSAQPLIVLDIHLNDQSINDRTVFIIYEHLLSLMPGSVGYLHMPFNLHTLFRILSLGSKEAGKDACCWKRTWVVSIPSHVLNLLTRFASIEQIIIFLTAPSNTILEEPFSFLDFAPMQTASEWFPDVCRELFQPSVLTQLERRANYPTELVILSGGGFWDVPDIQDFLVSLGTRCGLLFLLSRPTHLFLQGPAVWNNRVWSSKARSSIC